MRSLVGRFANITSMSKIDLPYFSQHADVTDPEWRSRACGIACLAMIIEYYKKTGFKTLDSLIEHGVSIDAFTTQGWSHPRLVIMAHNYGVLGYMEEFRSGKPEYHEEFFGKGIEKIVNHLKNGHPVIISTYRNWTEEGKFHMVVLTGYLADDNGIIGFYYSDPDAADAETGKGRFVDFNMFKERWRRLVIFLGW